MLKKNLNKSLSAVFVTCALLLSACSSNPSQENQPPAVPDTVEQELAFTFVDSTILFDNETASVSMRATFDREGNATMAEGYKFQFRSINPEVTFLSSISIVAGGDRIFIEEGQIALPKEKGITLQLSLEESLNIAQYKTALFQFRFGNESFLMALSTHKLSEYLP